MVYAGFWRRLVAHIIDSLIMMVALSCFTIPYAMYIVFNSAKERQVLGQHSSVQYIVPLSDIVTAQATAPAPMTIDTPQPSIMPEPTPMVSEPPAAMTVTPDGTGEYYPDTQVQPPQAVLPAPVPVPAPTAAQTQAETQEAMNRDVNEAFSGPFMSFFYLISYVGGTLYHVLFISGRWQATPGKRAMGCMVVTREGGRLSPMHALGRHLACIVSWLPFPPLCIGFYLAGWTREKTALHDMIAGSRVVKTAAADPVIATHP